MRFCLRFKFKLLFFCFVQFSLSIFAFPRDFLHFLLISFELTIQDRRVLLKSKLRHTVMTSYHYPHSGLIQKYRCACLGFRLCSKAYTSLCFSWSTPEPSQNNTKPWKPSLILIKYFHLSRLGAILMMLSVWLGSCLPVHTYNTI